jgi:hypothetical protein
MGMQPPAAERFRLAVGCVVKQAFLIMNAIFRGLSCISLFVVVVIAFAVAGRVYAQTSTDQTLAATNSSSESTNDQIAAFQLQLTNAWHQVEAIVDQPIVAYRREPGYDVWISSGGWFHPGASTPDFNHVDVRQSQELPYSNHWITSELNPGMMFRGSDLEFNGNTKLFYTNRDLPKKRLTEAEMLQINSLYRTIGQCQSGIAQLQPPSATEADTAGASGADEDSDTNGAAPPKAIAVIERIPQQTRILYGSVAIGILLVLVVGSRLIRKKSD